MKQTIQFIREKETKNTVKFEEQPAARRGLALCPEVGRRQRHGADRHHRGEGR
jgi:hypothetical protein